ncbi:MAG: nitroreductase family protein [Fimbriimonas sp.]|nr:nitroreductase family protein [Fimbriimonas sp.]
MVILALLEKGGSHGYELIKSLEDLSDGFYVPSPGMIYPALTYLEELGYAEVEVDGSKKRYRLTSPGLQHLNENRTQTEQVLRDLEQIGSRMADARRALEGEEQEDGEGPDVDGLRGIRNELRGILRGRRPDRPEESDRIAGILRSAISAIREGRPARFESDVDVLFHAIQNRRSMGLSKLRSDPVDRNLIERMLESANWAPSNEDTEPWRFAVFSGEGRKVLADLFADAVQSKSGGDDAALAREGATKRAYASPVWIAIGMTPKLKEDGSLLMTEEEELMAVACAVQNLHLMASAMGLAGMWHSKGLSVNKAVAEGLGWSAPSRLVGFFMCGWPSTAWPAGERGPLAEKVRWIDSCR